MPCRRSKYDVRFHPSRVKKIIQTDEQVGKMAAAVPVMVSRLVELFAETMLTKSAEITKSKGSTVMSREHMKDCIMENERFDFLRDLIASLPKRSKALKIRMKTINGLSYQIKIPDIPVLDDEDYDM